MSEKQTSEELNDWERWAKEVCTDFKIPFDNHPVGLRQAIVLWMADRNTRTPDPRMVEVLSYCKDELEAHYFDFHANNHTGKYIDCLWCKADREMIGRIDAILKGEK